MGKDKQKRHVFSEDEKKLIRELKEQLSMMGVPRQKWSKIIQKELKELTRTKNRTESSKKKSKISQVSQKLRNKVVNKMEKVLTKRMNLGDNSLEGLLEDQVANMTEEERMMFNSLFGGVNIKKIDALGNDGTFIMKRPDKKRMIVDLDLDDDPE